MQAQGYNEWRRLNVTGLLELNVAFNTDPIAVACVKAVTSRLLSAGIVFTNRGYTKVASSEFQSHINTHFVKFTREIITQICVQGFACYIVDNTVPRMLPIGAVDVRYRLNPDKYVIELACFKDEVADDTVYILVDAEPDVNGGVNSAMASYYTTRVFKDSCVRNALVADALRARPPVYTTTSTDQAFDERDLDGVGEIDGLRASLQKDNLLSRNKIQMSVHERQEHLVSMLNKKSLNAKDDDASFRTDPLTKIRNYDYGIDFAFQPIVPLALDSHVCVVPQAQSRTDLVSIFENTARIACICFGVNSESIGMSTVGAHASADSASQHNLVTLSTVHRFKSLVGPVLVDIYKLIWAAPDSDQETPELDPDAASSADEVTVLFPSIIPSSTMEKLFLTQILKYDAYKTYLHDSLHIPVRDMEKTFTFEEGEAAAKRLKPAQVTGT
jgi:hypothetical protein